MKRLEVSQKFINFLMVVLIVLIIFLLVYSNISVSAYIKQEQIAERNRTEYEDLAYTMSTAVNYMTEQARKFTITEDISCIELYWNEASVERHVDKVIERLDSLELTPDEKHLLSLAKDYTELLQEPDMRAMKLMSETIQGCENIMPERIKNYKLNIVDQNLTSEGKKKVAREALFSIQYTADQYTVKNAINDFQNKINERLAAELNAARQRTRAGLNYQMVLFIISIFLLLILIVIFYSYYILPVSKYISTLKDFSKDREILIQPSGSKEIRILADKFNEMYDRMVCADQAKSNFVATMSHEIRTPLNTIMGYLYLFKEMDLNKKQKKCMDSIELASKNLLTMVNNILDFSKLEEEKMEFEEIDFSIAKCIREVEKIFQNSVQIKKLKYKSIISGPIPARVRGDMTKLRQILMNVVSNAIKFTNSGGVYVQVSASNRMNGKVLVEFRIVDTGIGIPKDKLSAIFNVYNQAGKNINREYGGSGLGLAICKRIVDKWAGQISVESIENIGTTFTIKLPFDPAGNKMDLVEEEDKGEIRILKGKLLVVDDNLTNLEMEQEILLRFGFQVETAQSGEEALAKIKDNKYDCVLMDIRMYPMDGIEATRQIKQLENGRALPVIALTGDVNEDTVKRSRAAGMEGFLSKPLNIQKMVIEFERCLNIKSQPYEVEAPIEPPVVQENKAQVNPQSLHEEIAEFMAYLKACDFRAVQFYEEQEAIISPMMEEKKAHELEQLMAAYQLEEAYDLMREVSGYEA